MIKKIKFKEGFTLVEMLIALAILAMVVASTFTVFRSSTKSWQKGKKRTERYHTARIALGKMSKEISQASLSEDERAVFLGEGDEISFVSFVSGSSGIFELAEIEYWVDSEQKVLMRNEDTDPDYDFSTSDYIDILAQGVSSIKFSYYNGLSWEDTWDSHEKGLPGAVRIKIVVEDKSGEESETFEVLSELKNV